MTPEPASYARVAYEVLDQVALVSLNDPSTLNALSAAMGEELRDAISRAQEESRAILLGSRGRAFSSGANLGEGNFRLDDPERDVGVNLGAVFNPLIRDIRDSRIPIVAMVRGAAVGIGVGLACAADLIVMAEDAFFHLPFCKLGLVPDAGSTYMLSRAIGRPRALELMLLGERLSARQALDWGLVNRVVAETEIEASALELARRLAQGPSSVGLIRRLAWRAESDALDLHLAGERTGQRDAGRSYDFIAAVQTFRARRRS